MLGETYKHSIDISIFVRTLFQILDELKAGKVLDEYIVRYLQHVLFEIVRGAINLMNVNQACGI